jgi:hypothetical protein
VAHVVSEVLHSDLGPSSNKADGTHHGAAHMVSLRAKDVFDPDAHGGLGPVATLRPAVPAFDRRGVCAVGGARPLRPERPICDTSCGSNTGRSPHPARRQRLRWVFDPQNGVRADGAAPGPVPIQARPAKKVVLPCAEVAEPTAPRGVEERLHGTRTARSKRQRSDRCRRAKQSRWPS